MIPDIFSAQAYVDKVASNYLKYKGAIDKSDPSTPSFQLDQVSTFLTSGNIKTGVFDATTGPVALTTDDTNNLFNISQGIVRHNDVDHVIAAQSLKYAPIFNSYQSSDYYIATIYVDLSTLQNDRLTTLTLSQPVASGDTELFVKETEALSKLKVPFVLQMEGSTYSISAVDLFARKLIISSSSTAPSTAVATSSILYAIQQPLLSVVYTEPFAASGNVYLSNHINKAIVPKNSLRLYDILLQDPGDPGLVTTGGVIQKKTAFINWKQETIDETKATLLAAAIDNFRFQLDQSQSAVEINAAISTFGAATETKSAGQSISNYWLDTVMLEPEIISAGVDLGRYKKFDFPSDYISANNEFGNNALYELISAFDPQYYSTTNIYSGNTTVSDVGSTFLSNYGPTSKALPDVIVHGVTATTNTNYPSGETPVSYLNTTYSTESSSNAAVEIRFTALNSVSYEFYNVYRKAISDNKSIDLPLSIAQEIQGDTNFGSSYLPEKPASGSPLFGGFSGSFNILNTNSGAAALSKFAFYVEPRLPIGSNAAKVFVGGMKINLSSTTTYSGNASVKATLVLPNPDLDTTTTLGTSDLMPISKLSTTLTEFSFKFHEETTGSLNLTPATVYYVILEVVNPDATSFDIFAATDDASGETYAQGYTGSWGNQPGLAYKMATLGYVDNLSSTGSYINQTLPLSNYVFRGVRQVRDKISKPRKIYAYVPYFKLDALGNKVSTKTANEMFVRVVGINNTTGELVDSNFVSVPKNTDSGQKILLTPDQKTIDEILYTTVQPGTNTTQDGFGDIIWGTYDYLLIIADE
jgi:hypothetical protein